MTLIGNGIVADVKMRSYWRKGGPSSNVSEVVTRGQLREDRHGENAREDVGADSGGAFPSQGAPRVESLYQQLGQGHDTNCPSARGGGPSPAHIFIANTSLQK